MPFTPEELEEMRRADDEIERTFTGLTREEANEERKRDTYARDREGLSMKSMKYYRANLEKCRGNMKEWKKRNPEKVAEYRKWYYEKYGK